MPILGVTVCVGHLFSNSERGERGGGERGRERKNGKILTTGESKQFVGVHSE